MTGTASRPVPARALALVLDAAPASGHPRREEAPINGS
jgi:hypothetical protein